MFVIKGSAANMGEGWNRRDCLRIGLGGALGLLSSGNLGLNSIRANESAGLAGFGKAKSCILIYMFGGPSHIDIWDMKPNVPPEIRGEFKTIATYFHCMQSTAH